MLFKNFNSYRFEKLRKDKKYCMKKHIFQNRILFKLIIIIIICFGISIAKEEIDMQREFLTKKVMEKYPNGNNKRVQYTNKNNIVIREECYLENGNLDEESVYKENTLNYKKYYTNGNLEKDYYFIKDKTGNIVQDGLQKEYYESGIIKKKYFSKDDMLLRFVRK